MNADLRQRPCVPDESARRMERRLPGGHDFTPRRPAVRPLNESRSPLRWRGGKFLLASRIVRLMPAHSAYCEVFCGAAHVFFRKSPSPVEIINDVNGELVNFWRVLSSCGGLEYLAMRHRWALYSRAEFEEMRADASALRPEERAWRFLYLNRCSFGAKGMEAGGRPSFGTGVDNSDARKVFASIMDRLELAHRRLAETLVERLPWDDCLARYDTPGTLFYLDPPYCGYEKDYGPGVWTRRDFEKLRGMLERVKGRFILSVNDTPETRWLYGQFNLVMEPVVSYSASKKGRTEKGELVFTNYDAGA